MIPTEGEALGLHQKYGSNQAIVGHCKTVAKAAGVICEELRKQGKRVDWEAVRAGALLHDIGRNRVQTVRHGLEGAEMLWDQGVDDRVVEMVRKHVGAGISPEEAESLGMPDFDFLPRTLEERIVCFADKMVDADRVRPFEVEVERFTRKGHDVERLRALKAGVEKDMGMDPEKLVLDKIKESQ